MVKLFCVFIYCVVAVEDVMARRLSRYERSGNGNRQFLRVTREANNHHRHDERGNQQYIQNHEHINHQPLSSDYNTQYFIHSQHQHQILNHEEQEGHNQHIHNRAHKNSNETNRHDSYNHNHRQNVHEGHNHDQEFQNTRHRHDSFESNNHEPHSQSHINSGHGSHTHNQNHRHGDRRTDHNLSRNFDQSHHQVDPEEKHHPDQNRNHEVFNHEHGRDNLETNNNKNHVQNKVEAPENLISKPNLTNYTNANPDVETFDVADVASTQYKGGENSQEVQVKNTPRQSSSETTINNKETEDSTAASTLSPTVGSGNSTNSTIHLPNPKNVAVVNVPVRTCGNGSARDFSGNCRTIY